MYPPSWSCFYAEEFSSMFNMSTRLMKRGGHGARSKALWDSGVACLKPLSDATVHFSWKHNIVSASHSSSVNPIMSLKSLKKKVKLDHQGQILNITYKYSFRRPLWLKDWCSNPVCEDGVCVVVLSRVLKKSLFTLCSRSGRVCSCSGWRRRTKLLSDWRYSGQSVAQLRLDWVTTQSPPNVL